MTKEEKNLICQKIGEFFIRVCKNHNHYLKFKKCFIKDRNINNNIIGSNQKNAYIKTIYQFSEIADREYQAHKHENSVYEYITIFVNMVLQKYLDSTGIVDRRKIGMIGQELFDLSCYGVFGDKYLDDMEKMNNAKGGMRAPRNEKEAFLMSEYEMRIRNGEKLDFETFMKAKTSIPDELFWRQYHDGNPNVTDEVFRGDNYDGYDWDDEESNNEDEEGVNFEPLQ